MNFFEILYAQKNGAALPANFFDLLFAKSFTPATEWDEYDGTLPATYNANGSTLVDYRIYGEADGVGDKTENIYIRDTSRNGYYNANGSFSSNYFYSTSKFLPIDINKNIYSMFLSTHTGGFIHQVAYFDASKAFISLDSYSGVGYGTFRIQSTPPNNAAYAVFCTTRDSTNIIVTNGSTAPAAYVPYGYEVDMSVSGGTTEVTTPIYIGSDPLNEDEYVDYSEQKIYRMVGGVLTPTDPPVPLPALPTVDGTTITDYAGQSATPSRFYAKYQRK